MTDAPSFLEIERLTVNRGGVQVLDIPSLALREKEVISLIGPNGSGKSTLLLTLATLLAPTTGILSCRGETVRSQREQFAYRRRLAMVFQEPLLFDSTVYDNVASGLKIRGMSRSEIKARVGATLELFNMTALADRSARKLSGGEAQRTSLARAFAIGPELILLDEPFSALDPPTRLGLIEDLERILRQTATTAIVATHDQMEALRLSRRMVVMNGGRIAQSGPPAEVMNRPADEFVAGFVGMENVLTGKVLSSTGQVVTLEIDGHTVELSGKATPGEEALFCIRPENVTVATGDRSCLTSARNVIPALIAKIVPMGVYYKVHLDCGFPLVASMTLQSIETLHLEPGKEVIASFKATAVHLLRARA